VLIPQPQYPRLIRRKELKRAEEWDITVSEFAVQCSVPRMSFYVLCIKCVTCTLMGKFYLCFQPSASFIFENTVQISMKF
jgi:hypothetical protein